MTTKIAVSLPDELVAAAKRAVDEGRAASVTAYVATALTRQVREDDLAALLAEMRRRTGRGVIDASVVVCARERGHRVVGADPDHLLAIDPTLRLVVP